jgi:hypothetical protein
MQKRLLTALFNSGIISSSSEPWQCRSFNCVHQTTNTLSCCQLSDSLNWGSRERASVIRNVDRRRRCFTVHREDMQLLGINVCYTQQQQ